MPEDIKELIEKIQADGINAAQQKAREIEGKALKQANEIVQQAQKEAQMLFKDAQDRIKKEEGAANASLAQAARNTVLDIRKQINAMLEKIITLRVREALSADEVSKVIGSLIRDLPKEARADVVVSLEKGLLNELKEEIKKGITLKPSGDISAGFTISFDAGKSHFDFRDEALAEYISQYLKPKLAELLKNA